ncbi:MAG TPA: TMEM165/GDT1 family protein [Candidatus Thermoplasmatota archaeon]
MLPFLAALGLVFLMELGDKTQLATISLASRHPWRPVLVGAAGGEVAATALGAALGAVIAAGLAGALLYVKLAGGGLLLALGVWELLRGHEEEPGDARVPDVKAGASVAATAFMVMFLAEMGDKTQVAVIVLSGSQAAPVSVLAGASVALVLMSVVSVFVGVQLARRLKDETVRRVAAALLIAGGTLVVAEALLGG